MEGERVEVELSVPCVEGRKHPVRLAFTGWGQFEVVWNPCMEMFVQCLPYRKRSSAGRCLR